MNKHSPEMPPTEEEVCSARHAGFVDSISFISAEKREILLKFYQEQDARRESNIGILVDTFPRNILSGLNSPANTYGLRIPEHWL